MRTIKSHSETVWSAAFSPDSQLIASGSVDKTVKLWRTKDGSYLTTLDRHRDKVTSVVFSANKGAIVSASSDSAIIVWDLPQILKLAPLVYGCNWVRNYLQTNVEVKASDRTYLCQEESSEPVTSNHATAKNLAKNGLQKYNRKVGLRQVTLVWAYRLRSLSGTAVSL